MTVTEPKKKKAAKKKSAKQLRREKIDRAVDSVQKKFGKRAARRASFLKDDEREYVSTGSIALDEILLGGWVRGRIYEIYGDEAVGKTTLVMTGMREAQKLGFAVAYLDTEHAIDGQYAQEIGLDLDDLIFSAHIDAESCLEAVHTYVKEEIEFIVVDTVAAMLPRAEAAGEMGDAHIGLLARGMSQAMRKLTSIVKANNVVLIFVNQLRERIGVKFGNPMTTPGGRALKYYANGRFNIMSSTGIKDSDDELIGRWVRVKIDKSKTSIPFKLTSFPLIFGKGIDTYREVYQLGIELGLVKQRGAWSYYGDVTLGQGIKRATDFLQFDEEGIEVFARMKQEVLDEIKKEMDRD